MNNSPKLYIVATPIGNLLDVTEHCKHILTTNQYFIIESYHKFKKLLLLLDIKPNIIKIIKADLKRENDVISKLDCINNWVIVSDAGYPLICDPGYRIVKYFEDNNYRKEIISGSSPIIHALLLSPGPYYPFYFHGFLSKKTLAVINDLKFMQKISCTCICYISKYQLIKILTILCDPVWVWKITIAKELTKVNEKTYIDTASNLLTHFENNIVEMKGEFVLVLSINKIK